VDKHRHASVIVCDNQTLFQAGISQVLSTVVGIDIVARCHSCTRLYQVIADSQNAIIIVASTLNPDFPEMMRIINRTGGRLIVIAENAEPDVRYTAQGANGVIFRDASCDILLDCVVQLVDGIAAGPPIGSWLVQEQDDMVGAMVRSRLTPKEPSILTLIAKGWSNKEIAKRLNTTEQVIKNYLRGMFDKAGVSHRLELALFTLRHRALLEAISRVSWQSEGGSAQNSLHGLASRQHSRRLRN
jgi:DNA-binding NarL/FixJ family response regulator